MSNESDSMEIRRPSLSDLFDNKDYVVDLLYDLTQSHFSDVVIDKSVALAESTYTNLIKYIEDGSAVVYCAFIKERIVGFIWAYERTVSEKRSFHITKLVIHSSCRRLGIGKALILKVENEAIEKGISIIELLVSCDSQDAVNFYESQGFVIKQYHVEKRVINN